jgi:Tetrahydromethanopterin S-methyltransferase, subunit A
MSQMRLHEGSAGCRQPHFRHAEEPEIRELLPAIEDYQIAMEPIAYDCIGCKKCWGADAIIQLASSFEEVAPSECVGHNAHSAKREHGCSWPPHAGEYIVGNPAGSVAICTLSNRELPPKLIAVAGADLAIAGRCDTENIGIEKVVLAAKRPTTALSVQSQSGSQTASHVERLQAYLGRELAKAEIALQTGSHYEQDAGLGILPSKKSKSTELCDDLACSCHGA